MAALGLRNFRIAEAAFLAKAETWCKASYLVINSNIGELVKLTDRELPAKTTKVLAKEVYAYLYEDRMPKGEIASVVLNVAEDLVAGKTPELRAGDYITLQNHMRSMK
jgi:hypothetical protein